MIRVHIWLRRDQERFLTKLPGTNSELVRRAVDDFIEKENKKKKASTSPSGIQNG